MFHGPLSGTRTTAEADAVITTGPQGTGSWLTGVADVDRDGIDDVLVGTVTVGNPPAHAYGFRGPLATATSLAEADFLITVEEPSWINQTVDVVPAGNIDVVSSAIRIHGAHEGEEAGLRLLAGVDLDGDGLDDLLVGAPGRSTETESGGAVYLFTGSQLRAALSP